MENIEDREIEEFMQFLQVASDTCKEKGKEYEFECPICGEKARATKNNYNGHLWAKCNKCNIQIIE